VCEFATLAHASSGRAGEILQIVESCLECRQQVAAGLSRGLAATYDRMTAQHGASWACRWEADCEVQLRWQLIEQPLVQHRFTEVEVPKQLLKTQTGEPNDDG